MRKKESGFTLVEILIVMAIVGMIAGVVAVGLSTARAKGRDAKRKADMSQLQKALEVYYQNNSEYPNTGGNCDNPSAGANNWGGLALNYSDNFGQLSGPNGWVPNLAPTYISELPVDPLRRTNAWSGYGYCSDGVSYKLINNITGPESYPSAGQFLYDPVRPTWGWMICSGLTACSDW